MAAEVFALKLGPGTTRGDLLDELNGRLSAGLGAILVNDTTLTDGQWAGVYALQQCVQIAAALGRARAGDAPAADASGNPPVGLALGAADRTAAHATVVRQALSDAGGFADAIIYMAEGALAKGPDYESAAHFEAIKALAEKTRAAVEPAAKGMAASGPLAALDTPAAVAASALGDDTDVGTGAQVMVDLLQTIKDISDATAAAPSGRDYPAMVDAIDAALLDGTCGSINRRRGFVTALADLLCTHADGAITPKPWDPLAAIDAEASAAGSREPASQAMGEALQPDPANITGPVARLAREATYEIAALMQALAEHYGQVVDEDQRPLVVRGMALRAHALNSQLMGILDAPGLAALPAQTRGLSWAILGEHSASVEVQP